MTVEATLPRPIPSADLREGQWFVFDDEAGAQLAIAVRSPNGASHIVMTSTSGPLPRREWRQGLPRIVRLLTVDLTLRPDGPEPFGSIYEGFSKGGLLHLTEEGEPLVSTSAGVGAGVEWWSLVTGQRHPGPTVDVFYEAWRISYRADDASPLVDVATFGSAAD